MSFDEEASEQVGLLELMLQSASTIFGFPKTFLHALKYIVPPVVSFGQGLCCVLWRSRSRELENSELR